MKILFISPRPFGLMGTPGHYLLSESYGRHAVLRMISNKKKDANVDIVYKPSLGFDLHEVEFGRTGYLDKIVKIAKQFDPEIVCLTNYHSWHEIAGHIKESLPKVKFVLDIKSPLITSGNSDKEKLIHNNGNIFQHLIDLILTRCIEDVYSWIPQCDRQITVYPLGVKLSQFHPGTKKCDSVKCRRFVFIGSYSRLRKLDKLIEYIGNLPEAIKSQVIFDIYGSGPEKQNLINLVSRRSLLGIVNILDGKPQGQLFSILPSYDAGIGWVPKEIYDAAPSLKILEYLGSGLVPIMSATTGHLRNIEDGFKGIVFEENSESFGQAIEQAFFDGFAVSDITHNLQHLASRDWDAVVTKYLLPTFNQLLSEQTANTQTNVTSTPSGYKNWIPSVPDWIPLKKNKNSSLRIASILGGRLYSGLMLEADLLPITPHNGMHILTYAKPDLLLIESTERSSTGHWHRAQQQTAKNHDELVRLVRKAKQKSVPTVFWLTEGNDCLERYKDFAKQFDLVCCVNPLAADLLRSYGINAVVLLPCFQPALYNPFRLYGQRDDYGLNILFDGWKDLVEKRSELKALEKLKRFGLGVIESQCNVSPLQLEVPKNYENSILGYTTTGGKVSALRYAKAYVMHQASGHSISSQQWMSLEAAASRLPVVHFGALAESDFRKDYIVECITDDELENEFVKYQDDNLYRERIAHLGWREVNLKHTFAHRIQRICDLLGIYHDWVEYPKVSIITPSYRKDLLARCLENFDKITYPSKELILVFNGNSLPSYTDLGLLCPRRDVVITSVPSDMFAGAALNVGHQYATGEYLFRVDDDDHYGPNYIVDMVILARSIGASFFGKSPVPIIFQNDSAAYMKKNMESLLIIPSKDISNGKLWLGGNTISGSKHFFEKNKYVDCSYGTADTAMQLAADYDDDDVIAIMDQFNVMAERRDDVNSHTWKIDSKKIKSARVHIENYASLVV